MTHPGQDSILPGIVGELGTLLFVPNFAHCPNWVSLPSYMKMFYQADLFRGPYLLPLLRHCFINHIAIFLQTSLFDALCCTSVLSVGLLYHLWVSTRSAHPDNLCSLCFPNQMHWWPRLSLGCLRVCGRSASPRYIPHSPNFILLVRSPRCF